MPLFIKARVKCEDCEESIEFEIDWSEVKLDLNEKQIVIPLPKEFWDKGWDDRSVRGFRDADEPPSYHCPKHKVVWTR